MDDTDQVLKDVGPNKLSGELHGAVSIPGKVGKALGFRDGQSARVNNKAILNGSDKFTLSLWMKLDQPSDNSGGVVAKRDQNSPSPYILSVGKYNRLGLEGFNGSDWFGLWPEASMPVGEWFHVAVTYQKGGKVRMYLNASEIASADAPRAMAANDQGLNFGKDPYRGNFKGSLDDVQIFAAALTATQIKQLAKGESLPTRAATADDFAPPTQLVEITLARYDLPWGGTEGLGHTRMNAERVAGPNAVDWPKIYWGDQVLMEKGSSEKIETRLREGNAAWGFFQKPDDEVLQPGNHWFRPLQWLWGRRYVVHADRTARSNFDNFELWVFPLKISGKIQSVVLKCGGKELYNRTEALESLTLLLPQNAGDKPYEIAVNGKPFQSFDIGLKPVIVGNPKEERLTVSMAVADTNVRIATLEKPEKWVYGKEWSDDVAAQSNAEALAGFVPDPVLPRNGFSRYLGTEVARSPLEIYTVSLTHGMSGGQFSRSEQKSSGPNANANPKNRFEGGAEDYARFLSDTGYDRAYEMAGANAFDDTSERSYVSLARALAGRGLRFGIVPGADWKRPFLAHPNLAFFSLNLPDYRAPLFRDIQLFSQRLNRFGNFAGISIGADNAAYESFWSWAPPEPGRPWGEAFVNFASEGKATPQRPLSSPEPKCLGGNSTVAEFQEYIARYNQGFEQYGYYNRAVTSVNPAASATTGSYGSSPGVGARGGYPWATVPAKSLFANLDVMQAYDWNETSSSKPLHNVALLDRARSYYPDKQLHALIDDFGLFFGREARQRAYLLAATRGINAIGTQFLASPYNAKPFVYADQKELYQFLKSRGGAFKNTHVDAQIGVLYVNEQALLRKPNQEGNPNDAALFNGSHEGKTTEALIVCQAAGFPAKIVTPEELKRGAAGSMKALLLVGLHREDSSWVWSDGMDADLKRFVAGGGRILCDTQSVSPVPSVATGMQVRSYIAQGAGTAGDDDKMPLILERNRENIQKLRQAMAGVEKPVAASTDPTVWAIPHTTGDVQYVTVVNWGYEAGKNASRVVKPQSGTLAWNTQRAIYDLGGKGKLPAESAVTVDLTKAGFQTYALPSKAVVAPVIVAKRGDDGFYQAMVDVNGMRGVPVQVQLVSIGDAAMVYGASGEAIRLPFKDDAAASITLTATELLSGQSVSATVNTTDAALAQPAQDAEKAALKRFMDRRAPLVVALTPAQKQDPNMLRLAERVTQYAAAHGRKPEAGSVEPNGVVLSPQPLKSSQTFPRWRTVEADLVLLGTPQDNLLIFDQLRGSLLDGESGATLTFSPFVGEYDALNLVGDASEIEAQIAKLEANAR